MALEIKNFDEIVTEFNAKLDEYGSQITNRQSGGAYDLIIRIFSLMLSDAYQVIQNALDQGFVSTATGSFLDLHATAVGLTRDPATKAKKEFILKRTATVGVLLINIGDVIKTPILPNRGQLRWLTIESDDPALAGYAGQFDDGVGEIRLFFEADDPGSQFNTMEELLGRPGEEIEMEIEAGLSGVDEVTSTGEDSFSGTDAETDDELRERIIGQWSKLSQGATRLAYINFAKDADPRIEDANAFKGTQATDVRIVLSGPAGNRDLSALIGIKVDPNDNFDNRYTDDGTPGGDARPFGEDVHKYIRDRAPLTDFIILESVTEVPTDIDVDISVPDGYEADDVKALVESRLTALFVLDKTIEDVDPLEVGEKLKFSKITDILNDTPGVDDFLINDPTQAGVTPNPEEALTLGTITVGDL
jgi:uncharacterized phage protein gp47/JayE